MADRIGHRRSETWSDHLDADEVMLATALLPDRVLCIAPPA